MTGVQDGRKFKIIKTCLYLRFERSACNYRNGKYSCVLKGALVIIEMENIYLCFKRSACNTTSLCSLLRIPRRTNLLRASCATPCSVTSFESITAIPVKKSVSYLAAPTYRIENCNLLSRIAQ